MIYHDIEVFSFGVTLGTIVTFLVAYSAINNGENK